MKHIILFLLFQLPLVVLTAQHGNTKLTLKLPHSTSFKEYEVKKSGSNFLLNGDIIVAKSSNGQQQTMAQRPAEEGWSYIWPKGYIPIAMEDSIKMMGFEPWVIEAIDFLNKNTKLRFKPRTTEKDYIFINYMSVAEMGFSGGNSWAGRQGGRQELNLSTVGGRLIMHELLHAAGFYHEQSRPDRDQYIEILWNNIQEEAKFNYQIEPSVATGEYNYTSIMHYFAVNGFSVNNARTMRCKFGNFISECPMGGMTLNAKDIQDINAAYFFNSSIAAIDFKAQWEGIELMKVVKSQGVVLNSTFKTPKTIENGMYKIKINHTFKYMAIDGLSKENGARLVQLDYVNQANHKFYVRNIGNGYYEIYAAHSNRFLNAAGQSNADGTLIIQWDYASQDNVKWRIFYSTQANYPGWVMENKVGSPMQLQGGIMNPENGLAFVLMQPQRHDAHDYDPYQTFSFEKIGELPMSEKGLYKNSPGMIMKKNQ